MDGKEETLGKLYALRAGMSYISKKSDEIIEKENYLRAYDLALAGKQIRSWNELDEREREASLLKKDQKAYKRYSELKEIVDTRDNLIRGKKEIEKLEEELEKNRKIEEKSRKKAKIYFVLALLSVGLTIASVIMGIKGFSRGGAYELAMSGFILFFVGILASILTIQTLYYECEEDIPNNRTKVKDTLNKIENVKKNITTKCKNVTIGSLERMLDLEEEKQKELSELTKKEERKILQECFPLHIALTNKFSRIISVGDWRNLDLIVYYFESRRADSMKEALQLLDRQKRAYSIDDAVRSASNEISRNIRNATSDFMQNIQYACGEICENIVAKNDDMSKISSKSDCGESDCAYIDQDSLLNALLRQLGKTSQQLYDDVFAMKKRYDSCNLSAKA